MRDFEVGSAAHILQQHQTQMDAEGTMVGVSRQALDEVLDELETRQNDARLAQSLIDIVEDGDSQAVYIIIIDNRDPQNQLFVDIENNNGQSITIGKGMVTADGFRKIRISAADIIKRK